MDPLRSQDLRLSGPEIPFRTLPSTTRLLMDLLYPTPDRTKSPRSHTSHCVATPCTPSDQCVTTRVGPYSCMTTFTAV